jgi:hypothetical protein
MGRTKEVQIARMVARSFDDLDLEPQTVGYCPEVRNQLVVDWPARDKGPEVRMRGSKYELSEFALEALLLQRGPIQVLLRFYGNPSSSKTTGTHIKAMLRPCCSEEEPPACKLGEEAAQ